MTDVCCLAREYGYEGVPELVAQKQRAEATSLDANVSGREILSNAFSGICSQTV